MTLRLVMVISEMEVGLFVFFFGCSLRLLCYTQLLMLDSSGNCAVILGGKDFLEKFGSTEVKNGGRFYSYITSSSRLYSFIDDVLDGQTSHMDDSTVESSLMNISHDIQVHAQDLRGGWHPAHDDRNYDLTLDDTISSSMGGESLFSVGPLTICGICKQQACSMFRSVTSLS